MNSELIKDHQTYLKANQKVTLIECSAIRDSRDFLFLFHKTFSAPSNPYWKESDSGSLAAASLWINGLC